uniref:Uncharacterized protein n=1 Tax=viral metagenome TaxID=1070528 RepID=A0A6M3IPU2_9ZZZZ
MLFCMKCRSMLKTKAIGKLKIDIIRNGRLMYCPECNTEIFSVETPRDNKRGQNKK